ncbi:MAG: response regulator transcription factor [Syntrophothermus sp.]
MGSPKINLLIADNNNLGCEGMISLLSKEHHIEIIDSALNGYDLIEKYLDLRPDVILAEISLPVLSGTEAINEIRRMGHNVRSLFISSSSTEENICSAIMAGAMGLINRNCRVSDVVTAIETVYLGSSYFPGWSKKQINELLYKYENEDPQSLNISVEL